MEFRYRLKTKRIKDEENTSQGQPLIKEKSTADTTVFSESENKIINNNSSSPTMPSKSKQNNWKKDKFSICLLLFLYLLQGVPLGMAASIPLIIQTYGTTWSQQATFSLAFWPFSLKLLWAPIVDALYIKRFGRRKSWLIPIQYLIGACMIILSYYINDILLTTKAATNNQPRIFNSI
jgi:PAT family acetyl-CoA transporter-like MFS transporter 1